MTELDLKTTFKALYAVPRAPALVEVPPMRFLMADGEGEPNTAPPYHETVKALLALSYMIKFQIKKEGGIDYFVMPIEGLWWADDMSRFTFEDKSNLKWTALVMQPDVVTEEQVEAARAATARKWDLPALARLRLDTFAEGPAAQCLHLGPYAEEGPAIRALHDFIAAQGLRMRGKHHEIYLSDPRRTDPAMLRTIIRQPVEAA